MIMDMIMAMGRARIKNLRAAYVHVLADAMTSVLAIGGLILASIFGWLWLDPAIGIVGALVIANWSWGLIRDAGGVLLDYVPEDEDLPEEIRDIIVKEGAEIVDLHVWQLGPGHHGAIVSIVTDRAKPPSYYRSKLAAIHDLSHVTVEVEARAF
jgi:cation diffusion facilitator family transporter